MPWTMPFARDCTSCAIRGLTSPQVNCGSFRCAAARVPAGKEVPCLAHCHTGRPWP